MALRYDNVIYHVQLMVLAVSTLRGAVVERAHAAYISLIEGVAHLS